MERIPTKEKINPAENIFIRNGNRLKNKHTTTEQSGGAQRLATFMLNKNSSRDHCARPNRRIVFPEPDLPHRYCHILRGIDHVSRERQRILAVRPVPEPNRKTNVQDLDSNDQTDSGSQTFRISVALDDCLKWKLPRQAGSLPGGKRWCRQKRFREDMLLVPLNSEILNIFELLKLKNEKHILYHP